MDLRNVVKIEAQDGVWVPWGEESEDGCLFKIGYMGRNVIKKARKKSLTKKKDNKTRAIVEAIDEDILDQELMEQSVLDWKGLKGKHLKELLDPGMTTITISEENLEVEIPFTEENKELILKCYNLDFSRFVSGVSTDVDEFKKHKEEEAEKNS